MSKAFYKFYWVRGKIFENSENRVNAKGKALKYCHDNDIRVDEIYELSNKSELAYLEMLLKRDDVVNIESNQKVILVQEFKNYNKDVIQPLMIDVSFIYAERVENRYRNRYVKVIDNLYQLNKQFINEKILFDCLYVNENYLQVIYLDQEGNWKEWKMGDKTLAIKERKEQHKKVLVQKKAIRDRQKYDRLLKLRDEGKITERQSQELYRLEKVFGG